MRLDHAREFGAHGFDLCAVDRDARTAGSTWRIDDIKNSADAGGDCRQAANICFARCARSRDVRACRPVQQFKLTRNRVGGTFGFNRACISRIHEGQPSVVVARPDRRRQRVEEGLHGLHVAQQVVVASSKIEQFLFNATDVAQTKHRTAADGPAFRLDRTPVAAGQRHDEAAAVTPQRIDRFFHAVRCGGLKPGPECEDSFRHASRRDHGDIAENLRLLGGCRPGYEDLRLR